MKKRRRAYKKYDWRDHKVSNYIKNNPFMFWRHIIICTKLDIKRIIDALNSIAEAFFGDVEAWLEKRNEEKTD